MNEGTKQATSSSRSERWVFHHEGAQQRALHQEEILLLCERPFSCILSPLYEDSVYQRG